MIFGVSHPRFDSDFSPHLVDCGNNCTVDCGSDEARSISVASCWQTRIRAPRLAGSSNHGTCLLLQWRRLFRSSSPPRNQPLHHARPARRKTSTRCLRLGRLTTVTEPGTGSPTIDSTYDSAGDITSITDTTGDTTTYTYDPIGRILTEENPIQAVSDKDTAFTYDADGNLLTATDGLDTPRPIRTGRPLSPGDGDRALRRRDDLSTPFIPAATARRRPLPMPGTHDRTKEAGRGKARG